MRWRGVECSGRNATVGQIELGLNERALTLLYSLTSLYAINCLLHC
jgi:hypothetical protein